MADEIYVKPVANKETCSKCGQRVGPEYHWFVVASDGESEISGPFDTRGEAKLEAIEQSEGVAIVLLRADGSRHSEMRPASPVGVGTSIDGGTATDGGGS